MTNVVVVVVVEYWSPLRRREGSNGERRHDGHRRNRASSETFHVENLSMEYSKAY